MVRGVLLGGCLLLSVGCAAGISPETSVTYMHPEAAQVDTVALMPVTAGEGLEGFRRLTADSLHAALTRVKPRMVVIPADESIQRLSAQGLADTYAKVVNDYEDTGVLDKERLTSLSGAVGSNYMLRASVNYGESTSGFGMYAQDNQQLGIFSRMWSARHGDVVWEASSTANVQAGAFETTRNLEELLTVACREIARQVPSSLGR